MDVRLSPNVQPSSVSADCWRSQPADRQLPKDRERERGGGLSSPSGHAKLAELVMPSNFDQVVGKFKNLLLIAPLIL